MAPQKVPQKEGALGKVEALEIAYHQIKKSDSASSKKVQYDKFASDASAYLKDEREVILIAVKIR